MFELTMLGAILATVTTLAVSAQLGPSSKLYDREVSDGKIVVGSRIRLKRKAPIW